MRTKVLTKDEVLERLKRAVEVVREVCEPEFVSLFGSYAYGEPHEGSDVDVSVVYQDGADETRRKRMQLSISSSETDWKFTLVPCLSGGRRC